MTDSIVYIALAVSVAGLLILTYASFVIDPPLSRIGSLGPGSIGKSLHIRGKVSDYHDFKGGSSSLVLDDGSGKIRVYLDYSVSKALVNLSKARGLEVIGPVDEYKGILEIKPDKPENVRIVS